MCEVHKPEKTEEMLRAFFFEAMQKGYAVSPPKTPIVGLPGSKSIRYERGDLVLVDFWFATPFSNESHGMTVISSADRPMWAMHYGGFYYPEVIPFLKKALGSAYSENLFLGGRGPREYRGEGPYESFLTYKNLPERDDFFDFRGQEQVWNERHKLVGRHHYFGGLML
jgi:hypothetical protein